MQIPRWLLGIFGRAGPKRPGVVTCTVGGKTLVLDPAIVRRKLNEVCPDWDELVDRIKQFGTKPLPEHIAKDPAAVKGRTAAADAALTQLAEAITTAFDAPPLQTDGTGFSESERLDLLTQYLAHVQALLERTRPLVNSPVATASAGAV